MKIKFIFIFFALILSLSSFASAINTLAWNSTSHHFYNFELPSDGICEDNDGDGVVGWCTGGGMQGGFLELKSKCDDIHGVYKHTEYFNGLDYGLCYTYIINDLFLPDCDDNDPNVNPFTWQWVVNPQYYSAQMKSAVVEGLGFDPRTEMPTAASPLSISRINSCDNPGFNFNYNVNVSIIIGSKNPQEISLGSNSVTYNDGEGTGIVTQAGNIGGLTINSLYHDSGKTDQRVIHVSPNAALDIIGQVRYRTRSLELEEKIIDAVAKGDNSIAYKIIDNDNNRVSVTPPLYLSNCAHLSGNGINKIVLMRSNQSQKDNNYLSLKSNQIKEGFKQIEPFSKYNSSFSFYIDLVNYLNNNLSSTTSFYLKSSFNDFPKPSPGCENAYITAYFDSGEININNPLGTQRRNVYAYSSSDGSGFIRFNIFNPLPSVTSSTSKPRTFAQSFIHEIGHARGFLLDEESPPSSTQGGFFGKRWSSKSNCQYDLFNFKYRGISYANNPILGCVRTSDIYRPSFSSIMNEYEFEYNFNVISCGYLLSSINGNSPELNWKECTNLNGVIK